MSRILRLPGLLLCLLLTGTVLHAQLSGTISVPNGTYPTLASVITALNAQGVGAGGVIINLTAGNPQSAPAGGYLLGSSTLNASTSATKTVTINGNGNTVTAYTGTGAIDGMFIIQGTDYVTVNGLNLSENAANTSAATAMEWGYALVNLNNTAPFDGCQNDTIENCTITLNRTIATVSSGIYANHITASSSTALTITAVGDLHSNNKFYGNTISNVVNGIYMFGFAATSTALYDQNNDIGGTSAATGNNITNFAGTNYTGIGGITAVYQTGANISYNTLNNTANGGAAAIGGIWGIYPYGTGSTFTVNNNSVTLGGASINTAYYLYGIYSNATGTVLTAQNNSVTLNAAGVAAVNIMGIFFPNGTTLTANTNTISLNQNLSGTVYGIYTTAVGVVSLTGNILQATAPAAISGTYYFIYSPTTGISQTLANNKFNNITVNTTGSVYFMYVSNSTPVMNITGNSVNNFTRTASGSTYCLYNFGSPASGTSTITNNNFSNFSTVGTGSIYGIYYFTASGHSHIVSQDTVSNWNANGGAAQFYGIYVPSGNINNLNNNIVSNINTTYSGTCYGLYATGGANGTDSLYNNNVNGLSNGGSTLYGIYLSAGSTVNLYNNRVANLQSGGTGSTVYGLYVSAPTTANIFNNTISDLRAPLAAGTVPVYGIYLSGGSTDRLFHNTINLNPVSSGASFGAVGVYYSSGIPLFDLRNNIIRVNATPAGTGYVAALNRSSGTAGVPPVNFASTSGGNIYYAPNQTYSYLYGEGTGQPLVNTFSLSNDANFNTNCALFKSFMGHDYSSFSENNLVAGTLPFTYVPTGASFAKDNGVTTANPAVTLDFAGVTRPAQPDAGALQFSGTAAADAIAPAISYTPLPSSTYCTAPPTLSAAITDASGVNTTTGTKPRLYYKKSTEADAFGTYPASNVTTFNGWKYVEAGNSVSPFTFTPDYTKLTTAIAAGDTIVYFVVAQDNSSATNVGVNAAGFASGFCPSSVNLAPAAGPTSATPAKNSYRILAQPALPVITPATASICLGSAVLLTGTTASIVSSGIFGTGTSVNTTTGYPAPYTSYYGGAKHQMLIKSTELSAAGLVAGSPIQSVSFTVTNIVTAGQTDQNFQMSMGHTTATTLTSASFITGLTPVLSPATYTPVVGTNTHTLTSPFTWNGIDNIVIETDFSNNISGTSSNAIQMAYSDPGFSSTNYYRADNTPIATILAATVPSGAGNPRPNIALGFNTPLPLNWTSVTGLYKDAAHTVPLAATDTNKTVYAAPTVTTTYTAVNVFTGCVSAPSATAVVTVNPLPPATTTPSGSANLCAGGSVTLTAVAGYAYQWSLNGTAIAGATANTYNATAAGAYTVLVTNTATGCNATSAPINLIPVPLPAATATAATTTTFCNGGSVLINGNTGTGLTYQWQNNGTNIAAATNSSYTASASGSYTVVVTNSNGCSATSNGVPVTVNTTPALITPGGSTTFCVGGSVVLNGNTGSSLTYQYQLNGSPITGATSSSYTATASGAYTLFVTNTSTGCSAISPAVTVTVGPAPSSAITPTGTVAVCSGSTIALTTNTSPGLTIQWFLNGSAIANPNSNPAVFNAGAGGNYTASVSSGPGCSSTTPTPTAVNVNPLPAATATASGPTTFCQGSSVNLTANSATGLTYQWNLNGVAIAANSTSSVYTATAAGNYTVTTTNTATGCSATSPIIAITVNPLPTATATAAGPTTFCSGNSVTLNGNTGAGLSYQWQVNGNNIATSATSSSYAATTSGNYSVVVTNGNGCSNTSNPVAVTVNPLPNTTLTPGGSVNLCSGSTLTIATAGGSNQTYQWQQGGVAITTGGTGSSYNTTTGGSYSVLITNTATGCSATSAPTVVTVVPLPPASMTPASAATGCDSVVLTANSGAGLSYQWKQNGINLPGATGINYSAVSTGSYSVTTTNANGCSATSPATVITVNPSPVSTITYSSPLVFCAGSAVVLNTYSGSGLTYQWLRNAVPIPGATSSSNIASVSGSYAIQVTNSFGCNRISSPVVVQVNALPAPQVVRNGFTLSTGQYILYQWYYNTQPLAGATSRQLTVSQNGAYSVSVTDSNGCTNLSPIAFVNSLGLGHAQVSGREVNVYPNPTHSVIHVESPVKVRLTLRDVSGKVVMSGDAVKELDLGNLSDGMYLLYITNMEGQLIKAEKITKSAL